MVLYNPPTNGWVLSHRSARTEKWLKHWGTNGKFFRILRYLNSKSPVDLSHWTPAIALNRSFACRWGLFNCHGTLVAQVHWPSHAKRWPFLSWPELSSGWNFTGKDGQPFTKLRMDCLYWLMRIPNSDHKNTCYYNPVKSTKPPTIRNFGHFSNRHRSNF